MPIARVRVTSNRDQFMSCPQRNETPMEGILRWERSRGMELRVKLPPQRKVDGCGALYWEVIFEDVKRVRPETEHGNWWACEHELELD